MDQHEILKMIHAGTAALTVMVFVVRAVLLWILGAPDNMSTAIRGMLTGLQHLLVTALVVTGVVLLMQNHFAVQIWFYAKIVLFLVALSAMHKAFGKREIELQQRKAGVVITAIALVGIMGLIAFKPSLGHAQGNQIQENHAQPVPDLATTNSKPV